MVVVVKRIISNVTIGQKAIVATRVVLLFFVLLMANSNGHKWSSCRVTPDDTST